MTTNVLLENEKVIADMEDNMREKLRYVASKLPIMSTEQIKEVSVVDSALPSDTFNTAFGGQIDENVAREVFSYYRKNEQPMAWWVGPTSSSKDTDRYLESAGFLHDELDIGMACDLTQVAQDYQFPEKLSVRKCVTPTDYADFGEVLASIFDPSDEQVKVFYNKVSTLHADETKDMILFIGYEDNSPVATSCLFLTNVAGVYDIATKPDKRKLGYGSAMFYRALVEAKKLGLRRSVLQSSPDGLNIYKRFGFEEVCEFNVWSNSLK